MARDGQLLDQQPGIDSRIYALYSFGLHLRLLRIPDLRQMIRSLQSWRFIFALMIFLHHFPVDGKGLFEAGGSCGVSFFLILSGFVMSAGYGEKVLQNDFNYGNYFKKRLTRVYPLHLLCLCVAALLLVMAGAFGLKNGVVLGINACCCRVGFLSKKSTSRSMPYHGVCAIFCSSMRCFRCCTGSRHGSDSGNQSC